MKLKLLILTVVLIGFTQNSIAGTGSFTGKVQNVAVIGNVPLGAHQAGNREIKISNGFKLPTGVNCDTNYITTKKVNDPDGAILDLLLHALETNVDVIFYITDNATHTAYPGRCSLLVVDVERILIN